MNTNVRMGMFDGGEGSLMGAIHRTAAALDREIEFVTGCFYSNPEHARISGEWLGACANDIGECKQTWRTN